MNYRQIISRLSERGNEVRGIHLGLHRIAAVMRSFDEPQKKYPVLHIAGTNGKGSTAAMAESILRAAGCKTGLYTSPHLTKLEERIRVAGRDINAREFAAVAEAVFRKEAELFARGELDIRLTFFEFLTACAFLHFARQKIDVGVIEVGLGGRLDATNVVSPQACIITGISYDHQDLLGSTLPQIAAEKAGIIKSGVPVVSGCHALTAERVIRAKARSLGAPLTEIDRDCRIRNVGGGGRHSTFDLRTPHRLYRGLRLALAGPHQARNAALAVAGIEALGNPRLTVTSIRRGLAHTRWPGRLDEYRSRRRTLLDGAHNPEGALALRDYLVRQEPRDIHLVFGSLQDKDVGKMGGLLFPLARMIHLTPVANSRTAVPSAIAALHNRYAPVIRAHPDARSALRSAWRECPENGLVVVTGSLYLVGELLPVVRRYRKLVRNAL